MITFRLQNWKKDAAGKFLFLPLFMYVWLVNGTLFERLIFLALLPVILFLHYEKGGKGDSCDP